MANLFSTQTLLDGPRNTVIKVEGVLDSSDLPITVIADPATLCGIDSSLGTKAAKLAITDLIYNVEDGLELRLAWDATPPIRIEQLTGRGKMHFQSFGGLTNNAGTGVTGKITLATEGWKAAALYSFTLILHLRKQQR